MKNIAFYFVYSIVLMFQCQQMYGNKRCCLLEKNINHIPKEAWREPTDSLNSSQVVCEDFFEKIMDLKELHQGDTLLFFKFSQAMGKKDKYNFKMELCDSINGHYYSNRATTPVILEGKPNHWLFRLFDGTYLCSRSSSKNILTTTNSKNDDYCDANIELSNGSADIYFWGAPKRYLRFNKKLLACYKSSKFERIEIYKKTGSAFVKIDIYNPGYATLFYNNINLVTPPGIEATTIRVNEGHLIKSKTYHEAEILPHGQAVVLHGKPGIYQFGITYQNGEYDKNIDMCLYGTDNQKLINESDNQRYYFYKLSLNSNEEAGSIGFYWGEENGGPFTNGKHKAYMKLDKAKFPKLEYFLLSVSTLVNTISNKKYDNCYYDLSGHIVNSSYNGIVIFHGKKFINKSH